MSYDLHIGDFGANITFNCGKFFYAHIENRGLGGGLRELDGKTGKQCVEILAGAFDSIHNERRSMWKENVVGEPDFCAKYDSPNGWGSTVAAMNFLERVMAACAIMPRKRVRLYC